MECVQIYTSKYFICCGLLFSYLFIHLFINIFLHLSKRCGIWVALVIFSTPPFIPSATGNIPWARPSMACLNVGFWPGLNSKGTFRKDWGHAGPGDQWGKTTQMKKSEGNLLNANRNLLWTPHMSVVPARFSQASPTRKADSKGARRGERPVYILSFHANSHKQRTSKIFLGMRGAVVCLRKSQNS